MTPRPLLCTSCGSPAAVAEDVECLIDWGLAVVDDTGTVHPASRNHMHFYRDAGKPLRRRACCTNSECGHQWTLRRPFSEAVAS